MAGVLFAGKVVNLVLANITDVTENREEYRGACFVVSAPRKRHNSPFNVAVAQLVRTWWLMDWSFVFCEPKEELDSAIRSYLREQENGS